MREGRTRSELIHSSNLATRHFTATLGPPDPWRHSHICSDVLPRIYFQHIFIFGHSLGWCPTVLDMVQEPESQDLKRWTQMAELQVTQHGRMAWILPSSQTLLPFQSFHSFTLLSLLTGKAHLVPFPPFHFSPNTDSGMN